MTGRPSTQPVIYGLIDVDGDLRYIGKADDLTRRILSHIRDARRRCTPVANWIHKHGAPTAIILDQGKDWETLERDWIAAARAAGVSLLNVADGGATPKPSATSLRKAASAMNAAMARDPKTKRAADLKRRIGAIAGKGGLTPSHWAKLVYCAIRRPAVFEAWVESLIVRLRPSFSEGERIEFEQELEQRLAKV